MCAIASLFYEAELYRLARYFSLPPAFCMITTSSFSLLPRRRGEEREREERGEETQLSSKASFQKLFHWRLFSLYLLYLWAPPSFFLLR